MRPKKVAIIGAGPSGLVTAKTLLHSFSHGMFAPVVFDSRHVVGGVWPSYEQASQTQKTSGRPGTLDPQMRTNLSRFTVAFSDLSWESVMGDADIPMFPQAGQVGRYLAAYAERFVPRDVLRLGCRVTRTARTAETENGSRWRVEWVQESAQNTGHEATTTETRSCSEDFDFLIVASGHFARPYIPAIPGLEKFTGRIVHSAEFRKGSRPFLLEDRHGSASGNVAVIGGSMSGVEAASAAALSQSSSMLESAPMVQDSTRHIVHHIYSRPFWTLPTYLPHETSDDTISLLPLDLALYDLDRRPPGPIEYALGPIPEGKAATTNDYFTSLLGSEYALFGHMQESSATDEAGSRPPWLAIGNEYAEFLRSGAIEATMGRAMAVHSDPQAGLASIQIKTSDNHWKSLDKISVIVMATGFTPFESLSFLTADVLSTLEYSANDPFLPLVLDKGGTLRSEIPDIGFVGFYRGSYWGVMEMQAKFLGRYWAGESDAPQITESQRQSLRLLRHSDSERRRGQFPMGDYVGQMESFAKDLGIGRLELSSGQSRSGPVVPARYVHFEDQSKGDVEVEWALNALRTTSVPDHETARAAGALAIFRALHGKWKFTRWTPAGEKGESGTVIFHPRYSSDPAYDREYVCAEYAEPALESNGLSISKGTFKSMFRLSEAGVREDNSRIEIWPLMPTQDSASSPDGYALNLAPFYRKKKDGEYVPGQYVVHASNGPLTETKDLAGDIAKGRYQYTFHFEGVSIIRWECIDLGRDNVGGKCITGNHATACCRYTYER